MTNAIHFVVKIKTASSEAYDVNLFIEAPAQALMAKVSDDLVKRFGPLVKMREFISLPEFNDKGNSHKFYLEEADVC
jgi:hypothetical protein